jgi:4-hydroxy-4-methyl-2-oxoglutarate aldolase
LNDGRGSPAISPAVVDKFKPIECAQVADVHRLLGLKCVLQGLYPLRPESRICGPALTIRQVPLQDTRRWDLQETSIIELIQSAQAETVIVIDAGGRVDVSAGFGGNAATLAVQRQLGGIVIDGACRDSVAIIETQFPTFVRGTAHPPSHGVYRATCINSEPIQLGLGAAAISVGPGDLVLGDRDGIVVVPVSRAEEVLALAQERQEVDLEIRELLAAGRGPEDRTFQELRSRARRLQGLSTTDSL